MILLAFIVVLFVSLTPSCHTTVDAHVVVDDVIQDKTTIPSIRAVCSLWE